MEDNHEDDDIVEIVESGDTGSSLTSSTSDSNAGNGTFSTIDTPSPRKQQALLAHAPPMTQLPALKKSVNTNLRKPRGHVDSEVQPC